jgi:hypothetical protein
LQVKAPLSALTRLSERPSRVAMRLGGATLRVWLPSRWFQAFLNPWEPLSTPDTLGVRPSELFSSSTIDEESFLSPLPPSLFRTKPTRLGTGAPAVSPRRRSRAPFCFPEGLVQGRAYMLSWAFRPPGLSRSTSPPGSVSLLVTPLVLSSGQPHGDPKAEPQGV